MKKKSSKRAPKKEVSHPLEIQIDFKQKPTLGDIEQAINKSLVTHATDLFKTSKEVIIIIKEEGW